MAGSRQMSHDESASTNYTVQLLEKLAESGNRDAIVHGERRISGLEARSLILRYARALADHGVGEGDGVALFIVNTPEALLLKIAVHFVGGRLVFVPPEPGNSELGAFIAHADVKMFVFDPVLGDRVAQMAEAVRVPAVLSLGESASAPNFLDEVGGQAGWTEEDAGDGSAVCTLFYTGGTTGRPKLVTHRAGFYDRISAAAATHGSSAPDPRVLACTLLSHVSGHFVSLISIFTGQVVVLMDDFEAGAALSVLAKEKITTMVLVPPMLYEILDHPGWPAEGFPGIERIYYLGAPTAPSRLREAIERFGPVMHQVYGSTEHGMVTEFWPGEHDLNRPHRLGSCGKPAAMADVELRDEDGRPVAGTGEVGEIYVRGGMVMEGYWQEPERTREVLLGDWSRTGDLAYRDDEGYLYLVDRAKDIIVTGRTSDNVYSRLLDDFLCTLPGIRQAAAVGVPDDRYSEAVHLFLVTAAGYQPDLDELRRQVAEALGDLYEPRSFSIVGSLPRTTVGKIDKKALRAAYLAETQLAGAQEGLDHRV
jgi:fatty-acyl-CoA synthase